ncbi:MAG TPA: hypothetical protein VM186_06315 [Planctomycetota bacterium]|nr:hypothetical protein [Planctomycetota bacterium]
MRLAILMFLIVISTSGCTGRWEQRANDFADIGRLNVGAGFGASIDASATRYGRISAGSYENTTKVGFVGREGGVWKEDRHGIAFINGYTETTRDPIYGNAWLPEPDPASELQPAWADTERGAAEFTFSLHVLVGFEVGFDPGQLLDFVLGFAGVDIYRDDRERQRWPRSLDAVDPAASPREPQDAPFPDPAN